MRIRFIISLFFCITIFSSISVESQVKRRPTSSTPTEPVLTKQARQLASQYWNKSLIKCGGSYFLYSDTRLFEFRDRPQFSFSGQPLAPKPLSRTDILNGVDALPIEWDGNISVQFSMCRMNIAYYDYQQIYWQGWRNWGNSGCMYGTRLFKEKGNWKLIQQPKQTSCDQLSSFGFVFIPEGVMSAKEEARAEADAATRAMLQDAPNVGIHLSQSPSFPMDYFKALYDRAKHQNLFKVKLLPGGNYVIFSPDSTIYPGLTSAFRLLPQMDAPFEKANADMREIATGPNNSWIAILGRYGEASHDFVGENIPATLSEYLSKLHTNEKYPQIDSKFTPRLIALGPEEQWVMFYGKNEWGCHCRQDIQQANDYASSRQRLDSWSYASADITFYAWGGSETVKLFRTRNSRSLVYF